MAIASALSVPSIICLIFPTISFEFDEIDNFFVSTGFVFVITILTSFINGFGEGVA